MDYSKKLMTDFFTNSPIGIYITRDRRFCYANSKFQQITGLSQEVLFETDPLDLVVSQDREKVRKFAIEMLKGRKSIPYEFQIHDNNGNVRWIVESVSPIDYKDGPAVIGQFIDITESKSTQLSFQNSPIGIYIAQDRRFCYANSRFQEMTGYSRQQLYETDPLDLVAEDDRQFVMQRALQMLKGRHAKPYEFKIVTKNGSNRLIMETIASIQFRNKRAILGSFMDITETRHMENALQASEKKYHSFFELVREGIVTVNYGDGTILDANPEFQSQTGFDIGQLKEKRIWELQPPEFQEEAQKSFFRFKENRGGIVSWNLCQQHNGKVMPVEIVAQHISMADEDLIILMVRDISEREALMRALSLASEEWRKSFDALDDVVMLINPEYKIIRANMAAARLLKTDIHDLIDQHCYRLVHGTQEPPDYCPHLKARTKGIYHEAEEREENLDAILHFSASPIKNEDGDVTHSVEVINDVTSRRLTEEKTLRLTSDLAASFKGITEALSDLVESRDPYTAGHSKHVAELAVLTGKEMGLDDDELEGLNVCALLHDIGKAIIPAAILNKPGKLSKHEWGFIWDHPVTAYETLRRIPFPWPVADVVHQHHERLDGSGYPLGIRKDKIHLWARIIAVADIFDAMTSHRPYRPGQSRQKAMDELTNEIDVIYDSEVVKAINRVLRLDDLRVMVIDYDPKIVEGFIAELKIEGLEPEGYTESEKALEAFSKNAFPLVIIEFEMPEISGARLTRKMKELHPETEIIVTAKQFNRENTLLAFRSGASDFLEKPVDSALFKKSINRALHRFAGRQ